MTTHGIRLIRHLAVAVLVAALVLASLFPIVLVEACSTPGGCEIQHYRSVIGFPWPTGSVDETWPAVVPTLVAIAAGVGTFVLLRRRTRPKDLVE